MNLLMQLRRLQLSAWIFLGALAVGVCGCGRFMAARIMQAPNTYPTWLAPSAPVVLRYSDSYLTNFPERYLEISSPLARLRYRVVEPARYGFACERTNWIEQGRSKFEFTFTETFPARTNQWSANPRGTVFLLHGYGVGMFAMAPWALNLAQQGWRCVLVDLRGHGKSTGKQIYFGIQEQNDMRQLLDALSRAGQVQTPVCVVGESYGATLALRWGAADPRIRRIVAITPYSSLSNAVLNISKEYSPWFPAVLLRAGLAELPNSLGVTVNQLNANSLMPQCGAATFFVAAETDRITPPPMVEELFELCPTDRQLLVVPAATHEAVLFYFDALELPVGEWLNQAISATAVGG